MVEVNGVNEINEEEVRYEQVEGALGGRIIKTQEDGTQKMVALRDNDRDTMHDVESGGGGGGCKRRTPMWSLEFCKSWTRLTQMQQ